MAPPKVTGGDLYHLWRVSEVHLPRIADAFYDATRMLNGGRSNGGETDDDAFRAVTYSGYGGMSSSVAAAWDQVRDEMQRGFAQVGETVLEAATGIRQATNIYLHTDGANADMLNTFLANPNNHDPRDPESNPPAAGSDEDPGTPVLPS